MLKNIPFLKKILHSLGFLLLSIIPITLVFAGSTPKGGETLPIIRLPAPNTLEEKNYLGISGQGPFKVSQIKASLLLIEIFSLYCPQCQASAPEVNALYWMIQELPDLKEKIKIIGIGAGNNMLEVHTFKKNHQVPFPLFPDEDFKIHKDLGEVRTPYFFVVKIRKDMKLEVIYSEEGAFGLSENFLQHILKASGLK